MIGLNIQLKLIIFSFIFGFFFSVLLEWFNNKTKKFKSYIKILLSFILIVLMTIIYFIGIQKIGNAIFHIYSVISIIVGFVLYDLIAKYHKK